MSGCWAALASPAFTPWPHPMSLLEAIALAGGTASSGTQVSLQDLEPV
jgi:hypothetical protein